MKLPFSKKENGEEKKIEVVKPMKPFIEERHRLAAGIFGAPGTGKTLLMDAIETLYIMYKIPYIRLGVKKSGTIRVSEKVVLAHIVEVLRPTAPRDVMPSLDMLAYLSRGVQNLEELRRAVESKITDRKVLDWVTLRLDYLISLLQGGYVVLKPENEYERRIALGLLIPLRREDPVSIIMLDDFIMYTFSNDLLYQYLAVLRPFIIAINRLPMLDDLAAFHPVIVTPIAAPHFRYGHPKKYTILMNSKAIEYLDFNYVFRLASHLVQA
ncbi:MAG: hypothetical protein QXU93_08100 [Thermoproteus sp.]